jgi:GNAT superfamily N-acetyltransferase
MSIADALDQALWDYDADGTVRRPAPAVTAAQLAAFSAMRFDPNQRRGPDGRWISMGGGGLPEGDSPAPSGVSEEDDELYRELRSEYGWGLHQAADDVWQASRERETDPDPRWLEADPQWEAGDGDVVLKKLIRNLEWDLEDQPELADAAMELLLDHIKAEYPEAVAGLPDPPERGALPQLHPRANASSGYGGAQAARADALTEGLRSGVAAQKPLSAGFMGDTRLLTLNDGSQAVYKRAISTLRPEDLNWQIKDQTDAEHLSSLLAAAVGAPAPVVHRLNDAEVAMELVPGRPAAASALTDARRQEILATDDAVRIGLLDVLLNNTDRHDGNWMVDGAGGPVGIDHGMAFTVNPPAGTSGATKSPFATEHFINPDGTFKATNSLTPSEVTRLEGEIERIRPQFERAGRTDWLDAALGRLRQLGERAQAPAVTAAQHAAFTMAAQRAAFLAMGFNPGQRRGKDGKWIKMGGRGSAGSSKKGRPEPGAVATENDDQRVTRTGERAFERSMAADRLYSRFRTDEWFDRSDKDIDRREGVRSYFADSQRINAQLRTGERTEGTDELIREVDEAMAATRTKQPLLVYRGVSRDALGGKGEGDTIADPAYLSTSLDWDQARKFSRNANTVIMHIEVPEGTNVIAENATETEVLLPRGSVIEITKIDGDTVHGVLRPQKPAPTAVAPPTPRQAVDSWVEETKARHPGVKLDLYVNNAGIGILSRIEVPKEGRGRGTGEAILTDLTAMADRLGIPLAATPSGDYGGSVPKLKAWYKKHGFIPNKGRNRDYGTTEDLIRPAR